ncbi:MAG: ferredoxin [Rhodospirillales bacterium]
MITDTLNDRLLRYGLMTRGGFHPVPGDQAPEGTATLVLIGNAGPAMWQAFSQHMPDGPHPLDTWTQQTLEPIAEELGARMVFPFNGPPYYPFQQWALRADDVAASPIGPLIHPVFGQWHAYRGAFLFAEKLDIPPPARTASPCLSCLDQPCLNTCPVSAFSEQGYEVPACRSHIANAEGLDCLDQGCLARRACPVGRDYLYEPAQATFHMRHFLQS